MRGISILEVIVSLAVGTFVLGAIANMTVMHSDFSRHAAARSDMLHGHVLAVEELRRQVRGGSPLTPLQLPMGVVGRVTVSSGTHVRISLSASGAPSLEYSYELPAPRTP
jgi:hypothetical protein